MSAQEQTIAGLSCRDVLAALPDFLAGELTPKALVAVEQHLAGCTWCERFGGRYASLVGALRSELEAPKPLSDDARERLSRRLDSELDKA